MLGDREGRALQGVSRSIDREWGSSAVGKCAWACRSRAVQQGRLLVHPPQPPLHQTAGDSWDDQAEMELCQEPQVLTKVGELSADNSYIVVGVIGAGGYCRAGRVRRRQGLLSAVVGTRAALCDTSCPLQCCTASASPASSYYGYPLPLMSGPAACSCAPALLQVPTRG